MRSVKRRCPHQSRLGPRMRSVKRECPRRPALASRVANLNGPCLLPANDGEAGSYLEISTGLWQSAAYLKFTVCWQASIFLTLTSTMGFVLAFDGAGNRLPVAWAACDNVSGPAQSTATPGALAMASRVEDDDFGSTRQLLLVRSEPWRHCDLLS